MNLPVMDPRPAELDDVADRAERGRAFYFMFPGSNESDRWLHDFNHTDTPAHAGDDAGDHDATDTIKQPAVQRP